MNRQLSPSRSRGVCLIAVSTGLVVLAVVFGFVSTPGPDPRIPNYPSLSGPPATLLAGLVGISALLFAIAAFDLFREPTRTVVLAAVLSLTLGGGLFAFTLLTSVSIAGPGGGTTYVQPYPQTVYPIEWGLAAILFSPLIWYLHRSVKRAREDPNQLGPDPQGTT